MSYCSRAQAVYIIGRHAVAEMQSDRDDPGSDSVVLPPTMLLAVE